MPRKFFMVCRHCITVPEDADSDLIADDLIDIIRDANTIIVNSAEHAEMLMRERGLRYKYLVTIESK